MSDRIPTGGYAVGMRRRTFHPRFKTREDRRARAVLVSVGLGPRPAANDTAGRLVPATRVPAYLDYVEAKGSRGAANWAVDSYAVPASEAAARVGEIVNAEGHHRDVALAIAATIRAGSVAHAHAGSESDVARYVDTLVAGGAPATTSDR